jgi:predicted phosphodiesterase
LRLAVLADIHGNLSALEAVLEHLEAQRVDRVVVAGDIVNGLPYSRACWERLQGRGYTLLRGNHERYLLEFGTAAGDPAWESEQFRPLQVTRSQFDDDRLRAIAALPAHFRGPDLLVTHASFRGDYDTIVAETPLAEVAAMFGGSEEAFIVRAHNHHWVEKTWNGRSLLSIGSVGLPLDGRREAQYLIAERQGAGWAFEPQVVPYDVEGVLEAMRADYLPVAGPVGRLFYRELETARWQLIPFFRAYGAAMADGELTLEQAVSRYLAA